MHPIPPKNRFLKKYSHQLIVVYLLALLLWNLLTLFPSLFKIVKLHDLIPLLFKGSVFAQLQTPLKGVELIAYVTDRDFNRREVNERYSQAQYMLAPTLLDASRSDHPLVLLDCSSVDVLVQKMKDLGLKPVKAIGKTTVLAQRQ